VYLMWYDDNTKKATSLKIEEAINAYVDRFRRRPNVVLVNEEDRTDIQGVLVRSEQYIRRNIFWVGREEPKKVQA
jgi:hypothetical protein